MALISIVSGTADLELRDLQGQFLLAFSLWLAPLHTSEGMLGK